MEYLITINLQFLKYGQKVKLIKILKSDISLIIIQYRYTKQNTSNYSHNLKKCIFK